MPDINTKFLRAFLAVVDERNTTRAAQRLGVLPTTLTKQIRALEAAVGYTLLERSLPPNKLTQGRTQLTEAGLSFLPRAIEAMRAIDALFDAPAAPDQREADRAMAAGLLELALTALRQDLSEDSRDWIAALLKS